MTRRPSPLALAVVAALAFALASPAAALAAGAKKKGGGEGYLAFPTLTASIIRPSGLRGVLTVEAGVDAATPALHARAEASVPRLIDAYNRWLMRYAAGLPPAGPPDADLIGGELQRITDATLGRPGARLLLGSIIVN